MTNNTEIVRNYVESHAILDSDEKVVAKELWSGRYRVNVWKSDPNRISQSYFIRVQDDEITCDPAISA